MDDDLKYNKKSSDDIFDQSLDDVLDKRVYRIVTASSLRTLEGLVEELLEDNWGLLGSPFWSEAGYNQAMVKVPKNRIARQSLA